MNYKVERFFSKEGFVFKNSINKKIITANYTFGLLLRKIVLQNEMGENIYMLKQVNIAEKLLCLLKFFSIPTSKPIFILFSDEHIIGSTGNLKENTLKINFSGSTIKILYTKEKQFHKIEIEEQEEVIAKILKSRIRYGRKNIYDVTVFEKCEYWENITFMITALCDVIFFPEQSLRIAAMEYDLN